MNIKQDAEHADSVAQLSAADELAIQALLGGDGNRWNADQAPGSAIELSYSFVSSAPASGPGASGFLAFNEAQRAVVRAILDSAAQVSGLSFREVASGGQLRFGASEQSATKGLAAMPGQPNAGQVWMDRDSIAQLAPGSEGYAALLHEIGHALGLRHPRNGEADNYLVQWSADEDRTIRSVMSDAASPDGLFQSGWGAFDVAALRQLYGARALAIGDTLHQLAGMRLGAQSALIDDAGIDTLDASGAATGVALDLGPGQLSSAGGIDNLAIAPGSWIENAIGSAYDDVIKGNSLDNVLRGGSGNDWLDGDAGIDTAVFAGARSDYLLSTAMGKVFLSARDGRSGLDTLVGIEKISFADGTSITLGSAALGSDAEFELDQNASVSGTLGAGAGAAKHSYQLVAGPAHGQLTLGADGAFVYTPAPGYHSQDLFSFSLAGAAGAGNVYHAYLTVRPISPTISGSAGSDRLTGTAGNDIIDGGGADDHIAGSAGSDAISGGQGMDWLSYQGARANFVLGAGGNGVSTLGKAGGASDTLHGIERIVFSDAVVALDIDGAAGQAYRLYQAAFDRQPDRAGLGYWVFNMDRGASVDAVAAAFMQSQEFLDLYGAAPSAAQFVSRLYQHVLHRAPEAAGYEFWVGVIAAGHSRAAVLAAFAESAENQAQVIGAISLGIDYLPYG
ncbi:MAG: DUF4214 domain-containing protein [Pseudomonadota bacterium]